MTLLGVGKRCGSCVNFTEGAVLRQVLKDEWTFASSVRVGKGFRVGQGRGRGEKQPASQGKQMITLCKGRGEYYGKFPKGNCVGNEAV